MFAQLIAHSDWGSAPQKRVITLARWQGNRYLLLPPQVIPDPRSLISWLCEISGIESTLFLGFDFPIGLPLAYSRRLGIDDFLKALPHFGQAEWLSFYQPAETAAEISLHRPFYPNRPGHARQQHLLDALDLPSMESLRRSCDQGRAASLYAPARRPACPIFWTMGGQQVGKAAISGWRDVIAPAMASGQDVSIWPFSGRLEDLLAPQPPGRTSAHIVIAETYPAEFYTHLGIAFPRRGGARSGKRVQSDRQDNAGRLLDWADQAGVDLDAALRVQILDGFGASPNGEDAFDSVVGAAGMLNVLLGRRLPGEPEEDSTRMVEGGILGGFQL